MPTNAVVSNTTPNGQLVDKTGVATRPFLKWMQGVGQTVNGGFDQNGNYQGPIGTHATIAGRSTLASIVQFIDTGGVVTGPGIDFARAYLNKDTDHIDDGTGSPLAGGKAAEIALVTNAPVPTASRFLTGLVAGIFQKAQVAFSDLMGTATAAQIPPLSGLSGNITVPQGPLGSFTGIIPLAKITLVGADGSMDVQNGWIMSVVAPT